MSDPSSSFPAQPSDKDRNVRLENADAKRGFWRRSFPYFIGATIIYLGVSWSTAVSYSTIPGIKLIAGLVFGPLLATPLVVAHFAAQLVARWGLKKWTTLTVRREAIILNLPATILVGWFVATSYIAMNPRSAFEHFVANPVPSSVRVLEHGGGKINFAEGDCRAFRFEISEADFQRLIESGKFVPMPDDEPRYNRENLIKSKTGVAFDMLAPYATYVRRTPSITNEFSYHIDVEEFLFRRSSDSVAFFFRYDR